MVAKSFIGLAPEELALKVGATLTHFTSLKTPKTLCIFILFQFNLTMPNQGILKEGEGSVQLTSLLS
jgi:hypothetical protein